MAEATSTVGLIVQTQEAAKGGDLPVPPDPPLDNFPITIEREYRSELLKMVDEINEIIREELIPQLPTLARAAENREDGAERMDINWAENLNRIFNGIDVREKSLRFQRRGVNTSTKAARKMAADNTKKLRRQMKSQLGVDVFFNDQGLQEKVQAFSEANANLIVTNVEDFKKNVRTITTQALQSGRRAEAVQADILESMGGAVKKSRNRAALIARDQLASLRSDITRTRQTQLGVKKFVWRTAGDERVRPEHRALDGKVYTWKKGANGIYPGKPINCRCTAEPFVKEFFKPESKPSRIIRGAGAVAKQKAKRAAVAGVRTAARAGAERLSAELGIPDISEALIDLAQTPERIRRLGQALRDVAQVRIRESAVAGAQRAAGSLLQEVGFNAENAMALVRSTNRTQTLKSILGEAARSRAAAVVADVAETTATAALQELGIKDLAARNLLDEPGAASRLLNALRGVTPQKAKEILRNSLKEGAKVLDPAQFDLFEALDTLERTVAARKAGAAARAAEAAFEAVLDESGFTELRRSIKSLARTPERLGALQEALDAAQEIRRSRAAMLARRAALREGQRAALRELAIPPTLITAITRSPSKLKRVRQVVEEFGDTRITEGTRTAIARTLQSEAIRAGREILNLPRTGELSINQLATGLQRGLSEVRTQAGRKRLINAAARAFGIPANRTREGLQRAAFNLAKAEIGIPEIEKELRKLFDDAGVRIPSEQPKRRGRPRKRR